MAKIILRMCMDFNGFSKFVAVVVKISGYNLERVELDLMKSRNSSFRETLHIL